jgi:uncharacterized membrane protein
VSYKFLTNYPAGSFLSSVVLKMTSSLSAGLKKNDIHQIKPSSTYITSRVESIDLFRGLVMIIMALDHIRAYLHFDSLMFSPTDLQRTTPALFTTRLITHLCAPAFIFLAGTSAYFISQRKTLKETSFFLITRGLWLVILQVTLIRFTWNFDPKFHFNSSNIISTIGFCMIALAFLIHLRLRAIVVVGLTIVVLHNTLDNITFETGTIADILWSFLHVRKLYPLSHHYSFLFQYPIIPWVGVMALGFCLGSVYSENHPSKKRKKILLQMGIIGVSAFFVLRLINLYGDPLPWEHYAEISTTIMSFFNVEKYPPSLLYLCLTLGISLIVLGAIEGKNLEPFKRITLFGKVALFYYVVHIAVIHLLALIAVASLGFPWQTMIFIGSSSQASPLLKGKFGFSLTEIYMLWAAIIIFLYPCCLLWFEFKTQNKLKWWVSYV